MPLTDRQLELIESIINYKFRNKTLLKLACDPRSNKNLETGGDGILYVIVFGAEFIRAVSKKPYSYSDQTKVVSNFFKPEHLENTCQQNTIIARVVRLMLYQEHKGKQHGRVKAGNIVEAILCAVLIDVGDFRHHTHECMTRVAKTIFNTPPVSDEEIEAWIDTNNAPTTIGVKGCSHVYHDIGSRRYGSGEAINLCDLRDRDLEICLERIGEGLLKYSLSRIQYQEGETHEWFEYWCKKLEVNSNFKSKLANKFLQGQFIDPASMPFHVSNLADLALDSEHEFLEGTYVDYYQQYDRSVIMVQYEMQAQLAAFANSMTFQFERKLKEKYASCREKRAGQIRMRLEVDDAFARRFTPQFRQHINCSTVTCLVVGGAMAMAAAACMYNQYELRM